MKTEIKYKNGRGIIMSRQLFYNGRVYRDHRFETLCVLSENGVITEIGEWIYAPEAERIDLKGRRLVPGF